MSRWDNRTLLERFEEKYVKASSGCWEWTAAHHERGYGMIHTGYKHGSKRKMEFAHRTSLVLYRGYKYEDLDNVLHTCDNPKCVNPDHLQLGSHKDNMQDMIRKKRFVPHSQKLTKEDVDLAVTMRKNGTMVKDIAVHFNIDSSTASRVSRGLRTQYK